MTWPSTQQALSGPTGDDESLAGQAVASAAAFTELYQRYFQTIYRYHMAHTGNETESQDLTAQTFLAALEGIAAFRGSGSFKAWLFGIARRKMALFYRGRRQETPLEAAEQLSAQLPPLEVIVGARLQYETLSRALRSLAPERAEAIELCLFADLTAKEAGQMMGKSEAAVKMLVFRGLRDLKGRLAFLLEEK